MVCSYPGVSLHQQKTECNNCFMFPAGNSHRGSPMRHAARHKLFDQDLILDECQLNAFSQNNSFGLCLLCYLEDLWKDGSEITYNKLNLRTDNLGFFSFFKTNIQRAFLLWWIFPSSSNNPMASSGCESHPKIIVTTLTFVKTRVSLMFFKHGSRSLLY